MLDRNLNYFLCVSIAIISPVQKDKKANDFLKILKAGSWDYPKPGLGGLPPNTLLSFAAAERLGKGFDDRVVGDDGGLQLRHQRKKKKLVGEKKSWKSQARVCLIQFSEGFFKKECLSSVREQGL